MPAKNIRTLWSSLFRRKPQAPASPASGFGDLYRILQYRFKDESLLRQALTHRSLLQADGHRIDSNERLEFLGDAVLGLVVTEDLYRRFPTKDEGTLTRAKSSMVNREFLAHQAREIRLGRFLLLGSGEEDSGGRRRMSILSNAYEALLGAMFLDGGVDPVRRFLQTSLFSNFDKVLHHSSDRNYKSRLLEHVQASGNGRLVYEVRGESGPEHRKQFDVEAMIDGKPAGRGKGFSKKSAEQQAACDALRKLDLEKNSKSHVQRH
jgi:ribonuclease-3